jgi:hypothetical protein
MHALSRIRTHGLSVQAIKAYASDRACPGTSADSNDSLHDTKIKPPIHENTDVGSPYSESREGLQGIPWVW